MCRRDAVGRIGACLEQHLRQRQVSDGADRSPQRRARQLGMPVPVVLGVGIRAERAQTTGDCDESLQAGRIALVHGRVADVEQRLPVLRPAWPLRELRMVSEPILHGCRVAEDERGLQRGRRDPRMQREQPLRAAGRAAGRAADELVDRRVERQRARLDFFAQRVPGRESVLARDDRLRVVQRQILDVDLVEGLARERGQDGEARERLRLARLRRVEQRLGLLLQLFEIRTCGQLA